MVGSEIIGGGEGFSTGLRSKTNQPTTLVTEKDAKDE